MQFHNEKDKIIIDDEFRQKMNSYYMGNNQNYKKVKGKLRPITEDTGKE